MSGEAATSKGVHKSLSAILGADTVIGPIFVAYAFAGAAHSRLYVTIGKTF